MNYLQMNGDVETKLTSIILWLVENNKKELINFLSKKWDQKYTILIENILSNNCVFLWNSDNDFKAFQFKENLNKTLQHIFTFNGIDLICFNNNFFMINNNSFNINIYDFVNFFVKSFDSNRKQHNIYSDIVKFSLIFTRIGIRTNDNIHFI
jgi:hypothetical protein